MRTTVNGDITTVDSGIIVHVCNAQGVMGSGVAASIRRKWPNAFTVYRNAYEKNGNKLNLGDVHIAWISSPTSTLFVANLIGQEFYGREAGRVYVDYDAIRQGFQKVRTFADNAHIPLMIHYPQLGAGLAGGDWSIIESIIDEELDGLPHTLWMFE